MRTCASDAGVNSPNAVIPFVAKSQSRTWMQILLTHLSRNKCQQTTNHRIHHPFPHLDYGVGMLKRRCLMGLTMAWLAACGSEQGASNQVGHAEPGVPESDPATQSAEDTVVEGTYSSTTAVGGLLHVLDDGTQLVGSDILADKVVLFDLPSGALVAEHTFPVYSEPSALDEDTNGNIWVSLRSGGHAVALDRETLAPVASIRTCPEPRGIDADGDGSMWMACASGELVHFNVHGVINSFLLDSDLRDVVVETDQIFVSRLRTAEVLEVSRAGVIQKRDRPPSATYSLFLDGPGSRPTDVTFHPGVAWKMAAHPEGGVTVLHQRMSATQLRTAPFSERTSQQPAYYGPPENPNGACAGVVHTALTRMGGLIEASTGVIDQAAVPTDFAHGNDAIYVAVAGSQPRTASPEGVIALDFEAWNMSRNCVVPDRAPVGDRSATSVEILPDGRIATMSLHPTVIAIDFREVYRGTSRAAENTGYHLFHRNASLGVACATCHPDGLDDGHTWEFDDLGLRRTQNLTGGLLNTAPFHWDAEFEDLHELMDEVFVRRMGGSELSDAEVDALGLWMHDLRAPVTTPFASLSDLAKGAELFEAARCSACHVGDTLSDGLSHDVGTGGAFQTPSLRGVGARAPLMHDGCAKTMLERFEPACGGENHGQLTGMTEADIRKLSAYVQSL